MARNLSITVRLRSGIVFRRMSELEPGYTRQWITASQSIARDLPLPKPPTASLNRARDW